MSEAVYFTNMTPHVQTIFSAKFCDLDSDVIHNKISYTYRFFVVMEGSCTVYFGGREQICKNGDLVFLCPHQEYITSFHPKNFRCINVVYAFGGDFSRVPGTSDPLNRILYHCDLQPASDCFAEKLSFVDIPIFNSSFIVSGMPEAESRVCKMYDMFRDNNKFTRLRMNSELLSLIADVCEYMTEDRLRTHAAIAHRILDYIDAHCGEKITCELLSGEFSYHSSYINRVIRSYTGYSLHQCIMRAKVKSATKLLLDGDFTITDIAYRLAFCNSSHFCKVYQAYTGVKPTDVRRRK